MNGTWTTHHTGNYEGRDVEVKTHSEGGYRISTTQAETVAGGVTSDGSTHVFGVTINAGDAIDIDGESIAEVSRALVEEGDFSAEAAGEIVKHFPNL